jgi:hypothetical protein
MQLQRAFIVLAAVASTACGRASERVEPRALRVCADGDNLPLSNRRGEGFANRIAALVARELDAELRYVWGPQRPPLAVDAIEGASDQEPPMQFDISMAVKRGRTTLHAELERVLEREQHAIDANLDEYGVPRA